MKLLTREQIRGRICFSEQSGDVRSLALLHQRILLNFIESIATVDMNQPTVQSQTNHMGHG